MAAPAPVSVAAVPYAPDTGTLAVHCGALIDGVTNTARKAVTVLIVEGKVAEVGTHVALPKGVAELDLSGYTCLPGLIDMHTHLTDASNTAADLSVYYHRTAEEQGRIARANALVTLQAGFTTTRDVGTYIAWVDRDLRDAINAGTVAGPRLQVCGFYLTIPGGGGDLVIPGHAESEIPDQVRTGVGRGADQFGAKAEQAVAGGADFLKVIASGAVLAFGGVPGSPEMTPEEIAAVVGVAHRHGLKVAAHAHGEQSIRDAILAGVDTIEHASLIDDEGIALAKHHGVALVMDVYDGDYIDTVGREEKWPEEFLRKNVETTEAQRQGFTRAHAAGVPLGYGTDAAVYPHGWNARQFPIMVERGMSPMEAIRSATSVAAKYLGWEDRIGSVTPGRFGDLIAVQGDPLQDVTVLQHVDVVIKGGLAFKLPNP
jgi:imidazolonepropionase-like amidohydrolase